MWYATTGQEPRRSAIRPQEQPAARRLVDCSARIAARNSSSDRNRRVALRAASVGSMQPILLQAHPQGLYAAGGASFCTSGASPPSQSGCLAVESKWDDVLKSSYFPAIATSLVLA